VGVLLGLQCTLHPFLTNPAYREINTLPLAEQVAILRDPAFRERVLASARWKRDQERRSGRLLDGFGAMYELGDPPDYEPDPATSLAARAEGEGGGPPALAYDHLIADEGRAFFYVPLLNYADGNLDAAGEMLAHPHTGPGPGDGGGHPG